MFRYFISFSHIPHRPDTRFNLVNNYTAVICLDKQILTSEDVEYVQNKLYELVRSKDKIGINITSMTWLNPNMAQPS